MPTVKQLHQEVIYKEQRFSSNAEGATDLKRLKLGNLDPLGVSGEKRSIFRYL